MRFLPLLLLFLRRCFRSCTFITFTVWWCRCRGGLTFVRGSSPIFLFFVILIIFLLERRPFSRLRFSSGLRATTFLVAVFVLGSASVIVCGVGPVLVFVSGLVAFVARRLTILGFMLWGMAYVAPGWWTSIRLGGSFVLVWVNCCLRLVALLSSICFNAYQTRLDKIQFGPGFISSLLANFR